VYLLIHSFVYGLVVVATSLISLSAKTKLNKSLVKGVVGILHTTLTIRI